MSEQNGFEGEIRVHSRIVDYLSSGLYESPGQSLKELINNSFDADATRVDVYVKPDANLIIIEDNGHGMDRVDFEKHFKMISESFKRADSEFTSSGRPKIGWIGIGFIAANEICDVMEIVSTKEGSDELLEVEINFELMRKDPSERKREGDSLAKADYVGRTDKTDVDSHYTSVFLKRIRGEAKSILAGAASESFRSGDLSLYGLTHESVCKVLKNRNLKSWSIFDDYSRTRIEIALNVPIQYHTDWIPKELRPKVKKFTDATADLDFKVVFDGAEIRKPIVFNPEGKSLVKDFHYEGKNVSASGYFYAQHGGIRPQELQGLLLRIRNSSVGEYDPSFLDFSPSIGSLFQNWISAEVFADDRLEDAMNIDRRTLRAAHPAYVELQGAIHKYLSDLIKEVRAEIYGSQSQQRQRARAEKVSENLASIASEELSRISPSTADKVERAWRSSTADDRGRKMLLKKYSVDQLYRLVISVAQETLTTDQFEIFIERLTERLTE